MCDSSYVFQCCGQKIAGSVPPILTVKYLLSLLFQLQYPLVNMTSTLLCNDSGVSPDVVKDKALVVMRGVCDFGQKLLIAQNLQVKYLLIVSNSTLVGHLDKYI